MLVLLDQHGLGTVVVLGEGEALLALCVFLFQVLDLWGNEEWVPFGAGCEASIGMCARSLAGAASRCSRFMSRAS